MKIKSLKKTLELILPAGADSLNFNEFSCFLYKAASLMNDRPLGITSQGSGDSEEVLPVTPNLLLLGRASTDTPPPLIEENDNNRLTRRLKFIEELQVTWWQLWFQQVWHSLVPRNRWKEVSRNLSEGDICLKMWEQKMGKPRYVICRVVNTEPDQAGVVRSVTVESRPKNSRESSLPYRSVELQKERVSVQRLVLLMRGDEISPSEVKESENSL